MVKFICNNSSNSPSELYLSDASLKIQRIADNNNYNQINEIDENQEDQQAEESVSGCNCQSRILVVDDQEFNILTVKTMIAEEFQIQVDCAANGKQAVEMYNE